MFSPSFSRVTFCLHVCCLLKIGFTFIRYTDTTDANSDTARLIALTTKKCPNPATKCTVPIEKNEGCQHMTCTQCRHEFCWVCLRPWKNSSGERSSCRTDKVPDPWPFCSDLSDLY